MVQTTNRKLPRSLLVLVTTCCSLLIAGCAAPERAQAQPGPPGHCAGPNCFVDVNVQSNVQGCMVSPIAQLNVPKPLHPATYHLILWTIKTAGYHFEDYGISIKNPIGSGITPQPGSATMFIMRDNHAKLGPIPYNVGVVKDDGVPCQVLDPIIYNE